jgi:hypothetical protein
MVLDQVIQALKKLVVQAFRPVLQKAPIIVRIAPKQDPTGLAGVLLGALGLTGVLVLLALVAGVAVAAILFMLRSRKPMDH